MRTHSVNNAEKNNTNVIVAGAGGAGVAALASRYFPLLHKEHEEVLHNIKNGVKTLKEAEFDKIAKEIAGNEVLKNAGDAFIKNRDIVIDGTEEAILGVAKTLDETTQKSFENLAERMAKFGSKANGEVSHQMIKQAKKSRPMFYFVALATAASMTLAVLKNVIVTKRAQNESVAINYDNEGSMVIDAPDNMSLAIVLDQMA